jgi:hypothetical protein
VYESWFRDESTDISKLCISTKFNVPIFISTFPIRDARQVAKMSIGIAPLPAPFSRSLAFAPISLTQPRSSENGAQGSRRSVPPSPAGALPSHSRFLIRSNQAFANGMVNFGADIGRG